MKNDLPKKAERGDMRWLGRTTFSFKWKDTKEVTFSSSFHKAFTRHTTCTRVKESGEWHVKNSPVPDPVRDYTKYMSGVDLSVAVIQYYSVHGKTMQRHFLPFHGPLHCHLFHPTQTSGHRRGRDSHDPQKIQGSPNEGASREGYSHA